MLVLTFSAAGKDNCVTVAGMPYIYAQTKLGSLVLEARCPHRGGPLNLADFEPGGSRLICPWHGRAASLTRALRTGVPATRRGNIVTAVFPHAAATSYWIGHRAVSDDLAAPPGGGERVGG